MKIIDNKKDYYDYLSGILGIDEKIIYDRRDSMNYNMFMKYYTIYNDELYNKCEHIELRIGDYVYTFEKDKNKKWIMPDTVVIGNWLKRETYSNPHIISDNYYDKKWKEYTDCPLVLFIEMPKKYNEKYTYWSTENVYIKNPILSSFTPITKFISAEDVWDHIYDFISHRYDKEIIDDRTDAQHIESAGFDKKISFRNIK